MASPEELFGRHPVRAECCAKVSGPLCHNCPQRVEEPYSREDRDKGAPENRPYYDAGNLKAIDIIEAYARDNFLRGTALKYLMRAGRKGDRVSDLRKAIWYIQREIDGAAR